MQRHLLVGLVALAASTGCADPDPGPADAGDDIDLTESYAPGSNLDDEDDGDTTPSAWSERIDGRTYRIDLGDYDTATPEALFELVAFELGIEPLVMVTGSTSSSIDLLASVAEPGTDAQYPCVPTDALSGSFAAAPAFTASAATGHMAMPYWSTAYLATEDVTLSGTVSDSGDALLDVAFSAVFDLRTGGTVWRDIVGTEDPREICALLASFGAECAACADGEPVCMPVSFTGAVADAVDTTLTPLSEADAECR